MSHSSPAFSFTDPATTEPYTLSLHDALPICGRGGLRPLRGLREGPGRRGPRSVRSEEHTSELQSQFHLVCRLLLEKKKSSKRTTRRSTSAPGRLDSSSAPRGRRWRSARFTWT